MAHRRTKRTSRGNRSLNQRLVVVLSAIAVLVVAGLVLVNLPRLSLPGTDGDGDRQWATVTTDVLNVREGPSTDAAILGSFAQGDTVEVVGNPTSGFVPVQFGNGRAWMAREYLSFDGGTMAITSDPVDVPEVAAAESNEVPDVVVEAVEPPEVAAPEPTTAPVVQEPAERWIDIDRSSATVRLYEGNAVIDSFIGKIGRDPATDGFYSTAVGTFHVYSMNKGLAPTPFAEDTYLTDWVGFDPVRKNGIHSPVRDASGNEKEWQNATTLGCVRLSAEAAVAVFEFADIGMRVEVHD